ncbi:phosphate regulon sensor histidine kinase PhoR [Chitinibacteraceae bacterium HSL-7]
MLWLRSMIYYLAVLLVALFTGGILGAAAGLAVACFALAASVCFHLYNLGRLLRWLDAPNADDVPASVLLWQDVFDRLYQQYRHQRKNQDKLTHTLDRFMSAGEALPDGMAILDEHDRLEWCNPAAAAHLGMDRYADVWQVITNIVRQPSLREYLKMQDYSHPLTLRTMRPIEQVLSIQLVPFDSTRKLLLSRDITQLERVQTVHRDFVANVSHELRTPLTVVGGFAETLLDMPDMDAATRSNQLKLMVEQTARMQRLVEDLLTLSKLENGVQLKEEDVDVPQLVQMLRTEAEGLSMGRHTIQIGAIAPMSLIGNHDELHSALGNLVSNAIRYTPAGGTITLSWLLDGDAPQFVVKDTGLGIAPEHIPRLTERFYRVDRGRSRSTGGTGLGLAIVKHILQRHQGQLVIRSRVGEGSEFAARFPSHRALAN